MDSFISPTQKEAVRTTELPTLITMANVKPVMPMPLVFVLKNTVTGDMSSTQESAITLTARIV
uniref:Uncharacterized protein n=1 Tax=Yersinia enterocolitica TaxID=630 RepID=B0RKQ0_YEREN|nr:hypothetical protein [Yersinia enterocolitica]